jgi:hypothetical protein
MLRYLHCFCRISCFVQRIRIFESCLLLQPFDVLKNFHRVIESIEVQ